MLKDTIPVEKYEVKQIKELIDAIQPEIDLLKERVELTKKQLYIMQATTGIEEWENEFGIEHDENLTLAQRRGQIYSKLNTRTPASVSMLENMVKNLLDAKRVTIIEYPTEYRFEVYVDTANLIENAEVAEKAIYEARPAHLAYKVINQIFRNYTMNSVNSALTTVKKRFYVEVKEA